MARSYRPTGRGPRAPAGRGAASPVANRHELEPLGVALHGLLTHRPDAADVDLVVDHARLEPRCLLREQRVPGADGGGPNARVQAEDLEPILRVARVQLLLERLSDARGGRDENAA